MVEGSYEIMSLGETAKYLKIKTGKSILYKIVWESKIPAVKIRYKNTKSKSGVTYIQKLLGHNTLKEVFTHVSTKNLSAIKNSLDSLLKGGGM